MIKVQEYRGHIRNWEELCERLGISLLLPRKEREEEILVKAYETWGYEMADHMHGMFAFALWDEENNQLFCLRDPFGTNRFTIMRQKMGHFFMAQRSERSWSSRDSKKN